MEAGGKMSKFSVVMRMTWHMEEAFLLHGDSKEHVEAAVEAYREAGGPYNPEQVDSDYLDTLIEEAPDGFPPAIGDADEWLSQ